MTSISGKKESIYLIYKILEKYTDEEHYLTQQEIINKLSILYGVNLERKSISSNIETLINLGFDINWIKGKGYALYERRLEDGEIKYIVDALFSSRSLSGKDALSISKKLSSMQSMYKQKKYNYLYKSTAVTRTDNKEILYSMELINEAIENNKKVSFQYLEYNEDGTPTVRHNGFRFIVSPYYLINNFGKYYLISNYRTKFHAIQNYRIDYMLDVKIEDVDRIPINTLAGLENFDIAKYLNEHVYLFSSDVITAKVIILESYGIQYIFDYFGSNIKINKKDGILYCYIKASYDALFYWIVQFSKVFKVEEPVELVDQIRDFFIDQAKKYSK